MPNAVSSCENSGKAANLWRDTTVRWTISVGTLRISRVTTRRHFLAAPPRSTGGFGRTLSGLGAGALAVIGCVSLAFSAQASQQRPRFTTPIMDIMTPAVVPMTEISQGLEPSEAAPLPSRASKEKVSPTAVVAQAVLAANLDNAAPASALPDSRRFDRFPAVRHAVDAAFMTGEVQDWREGPFEGLVVAGEAYADGSRTCRETAILLRDGGFDGQTRSKTVCRQTAG